MEKGQRDWIMKNLSGLVNTTSCTVSVLSKFQQHAILSQEEVNQLILEKAPKKQSYDLYQILMQRTDAYETLIEILTDENQTGALTILWGYRRLRRRSLGSFSEAYSTQLETVLPYLQILASPNIVISSADCEQTIDRIQEHIKDIPFRLLNNESRPVGPYTDDNYSEDAFEGILSSPKTKRRIIVTHKDDMQSRLRVLEGQGEDYYIVSHENNPSADLSEKLRKMCLQKQIKFQGNEHSLNELCIFYKLLTGNSSDTLLNYITVSELMQNKLLMLSDGNIPGVPNTYIPRSIKSRRHISRRVLEITKDASCYHDILVFQGNGLKLHQLQSLASKYGNEKCNPSSKLFSKKSLNVRNILLATDDDFSRICKMTNHPVHLFNCIMKPGSNVISEIEWLESQGSLETIIFNIHDKQKEAPDNVLWEDNSTEPKIIADYSGMGKSTLMAKCAKKLLEKNTSDLASNSYIQYVVMGEFLNEFSIGTSSSSTDPKLIQILNADYLDENSHNIIQILANSSSAYRLGQEFVKSILLSEKIKCELLFDGIDELYPDQLELAKQVLQYFTRRKNVRVWITTMPELLDDFEATINVLGYTLAPFQNSDPVSILTNYWCHTVENCNQDRLKKFATHCLERVDRGMSESEKLMAGIPLVCRLLGPVLEDNANLFCSLGETTNFTKQFSLTEIYTKFVEKMIQKRKSMLPEHICIKHLQNGHMNLAIQLLFKDLGSMLSFFVAENDEKTSHNECSKNAKFTLFGILERVPRNPTPRFIHRTVAEYFAAAAAIELLERLSDSNTSCHDNVVITVIKPLLKLLSRLLSVQPYMVTLSSLAGAACRKPCFKFKHQNICYFLNHLLTGNNNSNLIYRVATVYQKSTRDNDTVSRQLWKVLNAAVVANFCEIACTVTESMKMLFEAKTNQRKSFKFVPARAAKTYDSRFNHILFFAAKFGSEQMMQIICSFFKTWTSEPVISQQLNCNHCDHYISREKTLLHIAAEAGNYPAMRYLLYEQGYQSMIHHETFSDLLNACLQNSESNSNLIVMHSKRIIQLLANLSSGSYLSSSMPFVLQKNNFNIFIMLLQLFQKKGRRPPNHVYANFLGQNIFHILPTAAFDKNVTPGSYHVMLERLEPYFCYEIRNPQEYDLNRSESYRGHMHPSVLKKKGPTTALKLYLETFDNAGWNPVHVAVSCLNLLDQTLDFFLKYNIDLNLEDHRGSTCIFKAVAGHRSRDFLRRLIRNGADYTHKKFFGEHVLHVATGYYNYDAVKLFVLEYGQNVNVQDADGNTPLHICFRKQNRGIKPDVHMEVEMEPSNQAKIISFLIQNGANIGLQNKDGETPLHFALTLCSGLDKKTFKQLKNSKKNLFQQKNLTLALKGIILNSRIGSNWHPALITPFANELLKLNADVNQTDSNNATLLHLAAKAHSMGVKYLIKNGLVDACALDSGGKNALMYMSCYKNPENCKTYNCENIRECLQNAMIKNTTLRF